MSEHESDLIVNTEGGSTTFHELLSAGGSVGFQIDDVLTLIIPLFKQVCAWHEMGLVAPLEGVSRLSFRNKEYLHCSGSALPPQICPRIKDYQPVSSAFDVVGHARVTSDQEYGLSYANLEVIDGDQDSSKSDGRKILDHPCFVSGYRSWESLIGHHDTTTDVLLLGQILASLVLDLDFSDRHELTSFATSRTNLFALKPQLHPVIAGIIVEMTELNRHRRASDLRSLIYRLQNYRDQIADLNLSRLPDFANTGLTGGRKLVQSRLRERLFEISRRNRLLYFKPSQSSVNLTVASVPMVLNLASIKLEQLFVWHEQLAKDITAGKSLNLGRWLRFEDQPYLPSALDKVIAEARHSKAEFGFAQLRLVLAFLHWHNLKDGPQQERISSPLLLLPIELSKKKGVKDQYQLIATSAEAEINPVLRHHLNQLYGLKLPESIDLDETSLDMFHKQLQAQIHASEPGVSLKLVDKPHIQFLFQKARQRLARFERTRRSVPARSTRADYSYDRENFRPLGLQLFLTKVVPSPLPQRSASGGKISSRPSQMVPSADPAIETERQTFSLSDNDSGNPYAWDFDLCSMTVGNFNYRKMSLVRDYGTLLENDAASEAFDRVFSLDPKPLDTELPSNMNHNAEWPVVAGDATQSSAISIARTGRSYIIQGPPGTGKSQTITNLIADYVARDKTVLFVCEKRAAIDVVFHRLRQRGLDELCCLIHDSQSDKKAFILNLKQTYEAWLSKPDELKEAEKRRQQLLTQMNDESTVMSRFDNNMRNVPDHLGCNVHRLLQRLIELRPHVPELDVTQSERLPTFAMWSEHSDLARRIATALSETTPTSKLACHAFRWLGAGVLRAERPVQTLNDLADRAEELFRSVHNIFDSISLPGHHWDTVEKIDQLTAFASQIEQLAAHQQLALLNPDSQLSASLNKACSDLSQHDANVAKAQERTQHWRQKLPPSEVGIALQFARANETSVLRWFKPSWWKLRKSLEARFDFTRYEMKPCYSHILSELEAEYAAMIARDESRQAAERDFRNEPRQLRETIEALQGPISSTPAVAALRALLFESASGSSIAQKLRQFAPVWQELLVVLDCLVYNFRPHSIRELNTIVRDLRKESDALPDLLQPLSQLFDTPVMFAEALRNFDLSIEQLEAAVANTGLQNIYRNERWLARFDGRTLSYSAKRITETQRQLLHENATVIRAKTHNSFRSHVNMASCSATQLNAPEKIFKKKFSAGRRDLEHEFGKTMRYKSIRDIIGGDSGSVVRDLKPIWLMSPLSVSDTLPLAPDLFDVVIFDEASQIPVEEAVPALYRAPQVIVVGDEMQLPPTNFFSASRDDDDDVFEVEEAGERVMVSLEADSFLSQCARNLPATLLAWHYRSRSESLISFSNAAFYAGNLFTIPDRTRKGPNEADITIQNAIDGRIHAGSLLSRPLSYHFLQHSPYVSRCNAGEAAYIAELVAELLRRKTKLSIGIVAFSEAQQTEIQSALEALASTDSEFSRRLEEEYAREEDDQFCGLFVKNLENVQGDERDIIILSICYGPDINGRMAMNFGPINQRGGEKRLNVIFSRARHHMAVVSSIRYSAITNDYNDGAAALKNFLRYAEAASRGEKEVARSVLENMNPLNRKQLTPPSGKDAVLVELAKALRSIGYVVDESVGQSRFRCDLAVGAAEDRSYGVGIIVDTQSHYANPDVIERYVTQPEILRAFGWRVAVVLTRDWYHEPQAVLQRIRKLLASSDQAAVAEQSNLENPISGTP